MFYTLEENRMSNATWTASSPSAAELTDAEYDLADKIVAVLEARSGEWLIPSRIACLVREPLTHVRPVLEWMAVHVMINYCGSYGIRKFSNR